jgi:hypothetical protein
LPTQVFWPTAHTPVHPPLTHVWFEHAMPFCQEPAELQVCGCAELAH